MSVLSRSAAAAAICLILTSCGSDEFSPGQAAGILQSGAKRLEGEQVALTPEQVDCGVKEELWTLEVLTGERKAGRLMQSARALKFADDIQIGDSRLPPYTLVRGDFELQVAQITKVIDEDSTTKIVEARVGINIPHICFTRPLPLMGVRKGQFSPEAPFRFQLALNNFWEYEKILH